MPHPATRAGATAKLISIDPEFKILCKNFADNFESYSGVVLKSRVLELLDVLQDTYELADDQAAFSILMFSTSRLRKRGDKSLQNAAMTMRILGSVVSVSDSELSARLSKLEDGILEGDLSGGDRSGVIRFATGHVVTNLIVQAGLSSRGSGSCRIWLNMILLWSLKRRSSLWFPVSGIFCGNRSHLKGDWRIFRFVSPGFLKLTRLSKSSRLF